MPRRRHRRHNTASLGIGWARKSSSGIYHAMIAASIQCNVWNTEEAASSKRATITVGWKVSAVGRPDTQDVRGPNRPKVDDPLQQSFKVRISPMGDSPVAQLWSGVVKAWRARQDSNLCAATPGPVARERSASAPLRKSLRATRTSRRLAPPSLRRRGPGSRRQRPLRASRVGCNGCKARRSSAPDCPCSSLR